MSKADRWILRNALGEHLKDLAADDADFFEALAEKGKVFRFTKRQRGHRIVIFRLKPETAAEIVVSLSRETSCSLTEDDSRWISGEMGEPSRAQKERWFGWGLLTA